RSRRRAHPDARRGGARVQRHTRAHPADRGEGAAQAASPLAEPQAQGLPGVANSAEWKEGRRLRRPSFCQSPLFVRVDMYRSKPRAPGRSEAKTSVRPSRESVGCASVPAELIDSSVGLPHTASRSSRLEVHRSVTAEPGRSEKKNASRASFRMVIRCSALALFNSATSIGVPNVPSFWRTLA